MNITELDSYNLADAVKFHNRLNPRLWGPGEQLLPEVRSKLLEIAADFQEFLGLSDLDVEDITLSGSNAAYSYTPHSDIDLHLVVNVPRDEVYQELFNAKKYQYNDLHNIRVRGADVELYVQPSNESHVSLGEYSIKNDQWIEVPKRKRAKIDQSLVRHKYEDLKARIESALKEDNSERVQALITKIKAMRQSGLDEHGEFGPENLAFKMLRKQGYIKRLYDHVAAVKDRELSLREQEPKQPVKYGYKTDASDYRALFKPSQPKTPATNVDIQFNKPQDYEWYKQQQAQKKKLAAEDAGETWDGVNPTTCMFLNEDDKQEKIVHEFIQRVADKLGIEQMPEIFIHTDPDWSVEEHSFGRYDPDSHSLHVSMANRHLFDVLRTTAHELAHCRQNQEHSLPYDAGDTGSDWENEAHAAAGIIMRDFADAHPELFKTPALEESASGYIPTKKQAKDPRYSMALTVDIKPGQVGKEANKMMLDTDLQGKPAMIYQSANQLHEALAAEFTTFSEGRSYGYGSTPLSQVPGEIEDELGNQEATGPEFPPQMPAGTTKIDVSDLTDWYRLGMDISDMDDADPEDYGRGPPQTVIVFPSDEAEQGYLKQFKRLGLKTHDMDPDVAGGEDVYGKHLHKELAEEFALLEEEYLGEIKMSPTNLRAEAAKTGAQAGMEFEMIVPNAGSVDNEPEYEPDYDQDTRSRSFDDIRDFFYDGDYNGRRDVDNLITEMQQEFIEWQDEQILSAWESEGFELLKEYIENNGLFDDEEAREEATNQLQAEYGDDITPEEFEKMLESMVAEKFDEFVQDQWDNQGSYYDDARDEYIDEQRSENDEREWLDEHYGYMSDIERNFDINWPYYYDTNEGEEADIDSIADDFSNAVGKPINASRSYHGARREAGHYVVEPDGSLEGNDSDDAGLEFVSPPMPIDEMMSDLNKVKAWADDRGCYTNDSTGLHINISVPNFSVEKLDYVKLALLLGDKYVLDQYGRASNTYTKSALDKVQQKVKSQPDTAKAMLDKMRGGLEELASKAIHSGTTDKYTSINTKSGYIEFRSPGGDWLNENFDKIENTLLRFTVALSAAMDPEAYRQEYLKKLYKLLEPTAVETKNPDTVKYFADYVAGKTPRAALRSFVKQAQLERKLKKDPTSGQQYWWRVSNPGHSYGEIEVVATTKEEAIEKALLPDGYPSWARTRASIQAVPVRPYDTRPLKATVGAAQPAGGMRPSNPDGNYVIFANNSRAGDPPAYRFMAADNDDADTVLLQWSREHPGEWEVHYDANQRLGQPPIPGSTLDLQRQRAAHNRVAVNDLFGELNDEGPGQQYKIIRMSDRSLLTVVRASSQREAETKAAEIFRANGLDPDLYDVFPAQPPQQQQPAPQPAGAGREHVGWKILLPSGKEVHQFSGAGNSQGDANRIAADWLRNNGYGVSGEGYEVVPVWREA